MITRSDDALRAQAERLASYPRGPGFERIWAALQAARDEGRTAVLRELAEQIGSEPEADTRRCDEIHDWLLFHAAPLPSREQE